MIWISGDSTEASWVRHVPWGSWTPAQSRPSAVNDRGRGLTEAEGPTLLMVREGRTPDGGSAGHSKT